mmetsp:Transcript_88251/g.244931  ORF Transcript_88251/g.244931 Transcript_88251/m.244931 type:complete len:342 (+) Transcript_88251:786-1811(+)
MTNLLCDSAEILRKQAAMVLASLLSDDLVKFRGSIVFRFIWLLGDVSAKVRTFAECIFARVLHKRDPAMLLRNFADIVCALNGWAGIRSCQGALGNEEFSLCEAPERRVLIYRFMLSLMTPDQRFGVCAQLVTTLLASFVDAEAGVAMPKALDEPAGQVLADSLALIACREMRLCFGVPQHRPGQDDECTGEGGGGPGVEAARSLLSEALRRNLRENVLPVLIQLKGLMERHRSPFLGQLRFCLRELLRDFREELREALAGDTQLASEVAFDLREDARRSAAPCAPAGPGRGLQSFGPGGAGLGSLLGPKRMLPCALKRSRDSFGSQRPRKSVKLEDPVAR